MKFSWKILLCTMLIMAAACGASGYFFVNYVFQTSMERETGQLRMTVIWDAEPWNPVNMYRQDKPSRI